MLKQGFGKTKEYEELKEKFDLVKSCLKQDEWGCKQIIVPRRFNNKLTKWLTSLDIFIYTRETDFMDTGYLTLLAWENSLFLKSEYKKLTAELECFDFFGE